MSNDVSRILMAIEQGDPAAADQLLPLVYQELRRLAASKLSHEKPGQTIQPTVLVHEAYLRLIDKEHELRWNNRGHFFSAAAEAMRRILIERARHKRTLKRNGGTQQFSGDVPDPIIASPVENLLALDEALVRLEEQWPDKAKLVKLRYFAGMTIAEAADALGISTATAERHWRFARAWLYTQLQPGE